MLKNVRPLKQGRITTIAMQIANSIILCNLMGMYVVWLSLWWQALSAFPQLHGTLYVVRVVHLTFTCVNRPCLTSTSEWS